MATKAKADNTIEVTFVSNKETENCIRMGATDKDAPAFGAIYIRGLHRRNRNHHVQGELAYAW